MKADPEHDGGIRRLSGVGTRHGLLEFDGGRERIHRAPEFDQRTVARELDHPPAVMGDRGLQALGAMRLQPLERVLFVAAHEPRVTDDIGGKHGSQPADNSLARQEASFVAAEFSGS